MGMIPCNFNKLIHVKSDDVQHNVYVCMGIFSFAIWPMCNHSLSLCRAWLLAVSQRRPLNMTQTAFVERAGRE